MVRRYIECGSGKKRGWEALECGIRNLEGGRTKGGNPVIFLKLKGEWDRSLFATTQPINSSTN